MYILNKVFNKTSIIDGVKVNNPAALIIPSAAEKTDTKDVAALLMKHYQYRVIKLEQNEKCNCLKFFKTIKAIYNNDPLYRGLYIIKDVNNDIVDFFIISTYGHYINLKDTVSNRLKKQHKVYNSPRDLKIKKLKARERAEKWLSYITVSLKDK